MSSLFDVKKCEQAPKNTTVCDIAWKMEELIPESPKRDGFAEAYLQKIGKRPEEYTCTTLVATTKNVRGKCFSCQQEQKTTKLCRLIQKDTVKDIPICTDCINVFIEYNPNSVYDLEAK